MKTLTLRGPSRTTNSTVWRTLILLGILVALGYVARAADATTPTTVEVKQASIDGKIDGDNARLTIQAVLGGLTQPRDSSLYGARILHAVTVSRTRLTHTMDLKIDALRGGLRDVALTIGGTGEIKNVTGEGLESWSIVQGVGGGRQLLLRLKERDKPVTTFSGQVTGESPLGGLPASITTMSLSTESPTLVNGYVRIETPPELDLQVTNAAALVPIEPRFLPEGFRPAAGVAGADSATAPNVKAFRFHGEAYTLPLLVSVGDPEAREVGVSNFKLEGDLTEASAGFTLTAVARVRNPAGGWLDLLSGNVALAETVRGDGWRVRFEDNRFRIRFDRAGEFPLRIRFQATVQPKDGANTVDFKIAAGALAPLSLRGLAADTQVSLADAARPERVGDAFNSFLPATGRVALSWRQARSETEGRLFYSAEEISQVAISPGLLRQTTYLELKIMQGEMTRAEVRLEGDSRVEFVQGPQVLAWEVTPLEGTAARRLVVQFNQPQRDRALIHLQQSRQLAAFPQSIDAVRIVPENATRFGGQIRVVNVGAVRLEMTDSSGLSQISPEQFVQSDATKALLPPQSTQVFAFRFAGAGHTLRIQADNILPELTVSEILVPRLGETELTIDAEFEIDVREAPLRELLIRVPKGYVIARLNAPGLNDHFLTEPADSTEALLRLVYGAPVTGRQVVQLRLERNQPLGDTRWILPRIEIVNARSVRGHLGVVADAGFRITPSQTAGLTELAPAFFPKKIPGLQAAFRLSDPAWRATFGIERLQQSIQADAFHLFSIGEGIAYGSSLITYNVSGAPVSTLRVELSAEYFNVEFTGKNIRNWQKVDRGYQIQLHTPVSGAYPLLATYERPFKAQGETLAFTGVSAVDARTEQGYALVISTYQFQVQPANVTGSLVPIETGEVPAEYRLFFDAPILAAYRYTARPFNLQLDLRPLVQAPTISQLVDRAALTTKISDEGQVVTEARYFIKNKGVPSLRLRLPEGAELWSVTLDGTPVVPVKDDRGSLIPLPHRPDPDVVSELQVKIASKARNARRLSVAAPVISAPVLFAEWRLEPAGGRRLVYRGGTLTPAEGVPDASGFAGLSRLLGSSERGNVAWNLFVAFVSILICAVVWTTAGRARLPRIGFRHLIAGLIGLASALIAIATLFQLRSVAAEMDFTLPSSLRFVAPVQQADAAWQIDVGNVPMDSGTLGILPVLLAMLGVLVWLVSLIAGRAWWQRLGLAVAWTFLGWASLRITNGAPAFFLVLLVFVVLHVLLPAFRRWWQVPAGASATATAASAATAAILALMVGPGSDRLTAAQPPASPPPAAREAVGLDSVDHEIRVEDEFAFGTAKIRWTATRGQTLTVFREPGILTRSGYATNLARLVPATRDGHREQLLVAEADGVVELTLDYQARVVAREGDKGFELPVPAGLVNRARITLRGLDVDVVSPQAVSVQRESATDSTNTVASLVLAPAAKTWLAWHPRTRDTRREKSVFYAELIQLFVPGPGVVEGLHEAQIRPAQGEVAELTFTVPAGATITDVVSPALSFWRFDPDARRLRVSLNPPQAKPFAVRVKSQITAVPLPFERSVGLLAVEGAAGQLGLAGIATGTDVQLDDAKAEAFAPINIEDFPGDLVQAHGAQVPGLTLRRAFRYLSPTGTLVLKAAPVEPDVRVESQQTLSLGEDRTVLAATLNVEVSRAGIFKLSFALPAGLDVESISGQALSHWTELKTGETRAVTLHLKSRTLGPQAFNVTLAGVGVRATNVWSVPRLSLREASKQRGQILIVPEQGLRLQPGKREGAVQVDPLQSGVRQKGVLAFRLLQDPWTLELALERVDAWIQVTSLQHVTLADAQIKVAANLQYEIENTGVKSLVVRLPAAAENVRFRGEQVTDFLARPAEGAATTRDWEIKLERRLLGRYLLQATYTLPLPEQATEVVIDGVQAQEVNLQRGFVTVQAGGRLQARIDASAGLQPTEWQIIPRALLQDIGSPAASYSFRLVEPAFRLPVKLERREAARLLPARVNSVTLNSVISDDGALLTQVEMQMVPGDKRLLHMTLPTGARFWFAFVNQKSVWPWQSTNEVLLPLEASSKTGEPTTVEFFYSHDAGKSDPGSLDLRLLAPRFDLPLENIVWNVHLNEKWQVRHWDGSMQLKESGSAGAPILDLTTYISNEAKLRQQKTREAEQFLTLANSLLQKGDPQQARRAFQVAYGLSQHDQAFNEDARVQLNNLKLQQALVGLNVRQARVAGESQSQAATPRSLWDNVNVNYSQNEAKQLLERNSAEENAVQQRLAERLIQQQDAAVANPAAIRATVPEQGRRLTFTRPLEVNTWTELRIGIRAKAAGQTSNLWRLGTLALLFVGLTVMAYSVRRPSEA